MYVLLSVNKEADFWSINIGYLNNLIDLPSKSFWLNRVTSSSYSRRLSLGLTSSETKPASTSC